MGNIAGCCTAQCPCTTSTEKSLDGMYRVSMSRSAGAPRKLCGGAKPTFLKRSISVTLAASVANRLQERCSGQMRPFESSNMTERQDQQWMQSFNAFTQKTRRWFKNESIMQSTRGRIAMWSIDCYCPTTRL